MPFVLATSRKPGAVLGMTTGRFLGTDRQQIVLHKLNSVVLYDLLDDEVLPSSSSSSRRSVPGARSNSKGDASSHAVLGQQLHLLKEFPLFATLKYVESVSLYDQQTGAFLRDVLFLLTAKQEVSLIAFATVGETKPARGDGAQPPRAAGNDGSSVVAVTLYHGEVDGCLYQYYPGETNLAAATPRGTVIPPTLGQQKHVSHSSLTPYVVFAVTRGELYVLDVLAAMGSFAKRKGEDGPMRKRLLLLQKGSVPTTRSDSRGGATTREALFPATFWQLAAERASSSECVSKCALHSTEYEVRDIAFMPPHCSPLCQPPSEHVQLSRGNTEGSHHHANATTTPFSPVPSSTQRVSRGGGGSDDCLVLLLLFTDIHGRTHVASYSMECTPPKLADERGRSAAIARDEENVPRSTPFRYLEGLLDGYDQRLARMGVLVSNCDPTAAKVLALGDVTLLIGSLLVTAVPNNNLANVRTGSGTLGTVTGTGAIGGGGVTRTVTSVTAELPQGLDFACACPSQTCCRLPPGGANANTTTSTTAPPNAFLFFKDGTVVAVTTAGVFAQDDIDGMLSRLPGKLDVVSSDVMHLGRGRFLASSRFDSTVIVDLACVGEGDDSSRQVAMAMVVANAGPVLDLTVMRDDAACPTIVAATGIGKNGGVSLIRAAATVTQLHSSTLSPLQATAVHQAGRLVAITSEYGSRFFCLESYHGAERCAGSRDEPIAPLQSGATPQDHTHRQRLPRHHAQGTQQAATAVPRLSSDVAFDTVLGDAHIKALLQLDEEDSSHYVVVSRSGVHRVVLVATQSGGWKLERHAPLPSAAASLDVPVSFCARALAKACAADGTPSTGLRRRESFVALSDGRSVVNCYRGVSGVGTAAPLFQVPLRHPISCLSVAAACVPHGLPSGQQHGGKEGTEATPVAVMILTGDWTGCLDVTLVHDAGLCAEGQRGPSTERVQVRGRHRVSLAAVPRSIAVLPSISEGGASAILCPRVFVGLVNGCFQQVNVSQLLVEAAAAHPTNGAGPTAPPVASGALEATGPVFLMRQPVNVSPVEGTDMLLCRGPSPILMLVSPLVAEDSDSDARAWRSKVELTGVSVHGLVDYQCCRCPAPHATAATAAVGDMPWNETMVFLTNYHGRHVLTLGSLPETAQKTSQTFLRMGCTVTHVRHIRNWGKFALSLRHPDTDVIAFLPSDVMDPAWRAPLLPSHSFHLLENERCVFMEPLFLGGENVEDMNGTDGRANRNRSARDPTWRGTAAGDFVVLVGSTFAFPDEQRPRSSRVTWYRRSNDNRPTERASKDIGGQLQCCCPVPGYRGRIALGVSGCVLLFAWNAAEKTFVAEERLRIGMMVTKLIPIYDAHLSTPPSESGVGDGDAPLIRGRPDDGVPSRTACLVALDARYSAMFVAVDCVQGGLTVTARDKDLRGIMDGEIVDTIIATQSPARLSASTRLSGGGTTTQQQELCLCDENMNFLSIQRPASSTWPTGPSTAAVGGPPSQQHPLNGAPAVGGAAPSGGAETTTAGSAGRGGGQGSQVGSPQPSHGEAAFQSGTGPGSNASPGSPANPGLTRLRPRAAAHLGDLVTVMQRGSLALATVEEDAVPSLDCLIPGFGSDQLIWGSTHGAFGVISPVSRVTYFFLKSLEQAVLFTTSSFPTGGFTYDGFREPSSIAQARSFNRAAGAPPPPSSGTVGSSTSQHAGGAVDVCSADVIEGYLELHAEETRAMVLRCAEASMAGAFACGTPLHDSSGVPALLSLRMMTPKAFHSYLADGVHRELCNAALAAERLPTLPLQHASVEALVLNLQRTH